MLISTQTSFYTHDLFFLNKTSVFSCDSKMLLSDLVSICPLNYFLMSLFLSGITNSLQTFLLVALILLFVCSRNPLHLLIHIFPWAAVASFWTRLCSERPWGSKSPAATEGTQETSPVAPNSTQTLPVNFLCSHKAFQRIRWWWHPCVC